MKCVCLPSIYIYVASDNILSHCIPVHHMPQKYSLCVWEDQSSNQLESPLSPNTAFYGSNENMLLPVYPVLKIKMILLLKIIRIDSYLQEIVMTM